MTIIQGKTLYIPYFISIISMIAHYLTHLLYIKESRKNFSSIDDKVSLELKELNINLSRIDSVEDVIDSLEYLFVKEENTIASFIKYMEDHTDSKYLINAQKIGILLSSML